MLKINFIYFSFPNFCSLSLTLLATPSNFDHHTHAFSPLPQQSPPPFTSEILCYNSPTRQKETTTQRHTHIQTASEILPKNVTNFSTTTLAAKNHHTPTEIVFLLFSSAAKGLYLYWENFLFFLQAGRT